MDYKGIAQQLNWEEEDVRKLYNKIFFLVQRECRDSLLPTIHLQEFGKFYVPKKTLDAICKVYIKEMRKGNYSNVELFRMNWKARATKSYNRV